MKQPLGGQSMEKASTPVEVGLQSLTFRDGIYYRHQLHPKVTLVSTSGVGTTFSLSTLSLLFLDLSLTSLCL